MTDKIPVDVDIKPSLEFETELNILNTEDDLSIQSAKQFESDLLSETEIELVVANIQPDISTSSTKQKKIMVGSRSRDVFFGAHLCRIDHFAY